MVHPIKRALTWGIFIAAATIVPLSASAAPARLSNDDMYRVLNITTNKLGTYNNNVTAQCGDTLEFRLRLNNTGAQTMPKVLVGATLEGRGTTSPHSVVTVTVPDSAATLTSDRTSVTTNKNASLTYAAGSTELLDTNAVKVSTLPDGITSGTPISIGSLAPTPRQERFVQFQASVNCQPTTATPAPVKSTPPAAAPSTSSSSPTATAALANTGPGSSVALFIGVALAAGLGHLLWRKVKLTGRVN